MIELSNFVLEYLKEHKIPLTVVLDARRLTCETIDLLPNFAGAMALHGKLFAATDIVCCDSHFELQDEDGQCVICYPELIESAIPEGEVGSVYIAGSLLRETMVIGSTTEEVESRVKDCVDSGLCLTTDWELLASFDSVAKPKEIEFLAQASLLDRARKDVFLWKTGIRQPVHSVFRCSFKEAYAAVEARTRFGQVAETRPPHILAKYNLLHANGAVNSSTLPEPKRNVDPLIASVIETEEFLRDFLRNRHFPPLNVRVTSTFLPEDIDFSIPILNDLRGHETLTLGLFEQSIWLLIDAENGHPEQVAKLKDMPSTALHALAGSIPALIERITTFDYDSWARGVCESIATALRTARALPRFYSAVDDLTELIKHSEQLIGRQWIQNVCDIAIPVHGLLYDGEFVPVFVEDEDDETANVSYHPLFIGDTRLNFAKSRSVTRYLKFCLKQLKLVEAIDSLDGDSIHELEPSIQIRVATFIPQFIKAIIDAQDPTGVNSLISGIKDALKKAAKRNLD